MISGFAELDSKRAQNFFFAHILISLGSSCFVLCSLLFFCRHLYIWTELSSVPGTWARLPGRTLTHCEWTVGGHNRSLSVRTGAQVLACYYTSVPGAALIKLSFVHTVAFVRLRYTHTYMVPYKRGHKKFVSLQLFVRTSNSFLCVGIFYIGDEMLSA